MRRLIAALGCWALAGAGHAQSAKVAPPEQIAGVPASSQTAMQQVGGSTDPLAAPLQIAPGSGSRLTAPQVAAPTLPTPAAVQIGRREGAGPAVRQLAPAGRTAEGAEALSTPGQGRTAAVERVEGADRCDPAAEGQGRAAQCAGIIENRAEEFARAPVPADTRSPEERLLDGQRAPSAADARQAARQLASGDIDESLAAQAIASGQMARTESEETAGAPGDATLTDQQAAAALVQSIIIDLTNRPPS